MHASSYLLLVLLAPACCVARCRSVSGSAPSFTLGGVKYTHADAIQNGGNHTDAHVECFRTEGHATFCLPSWLILVSGKAGSSAMWKFLCLDKDTHACGTTKEMHYTEWREKNEVAAALRHFPSTPGAAAGVAASSNANFPGAGVLDFLLDSSCNKQIHLVRNPVDRTYSAWKYFSYKDIDGKDAGGHASSIPHSLPRTPLNFDWAIARCLRDPGRPRIGPDSFQDNCADLNTANVFRANGWVDPVMRHLYTNREPDRLLVIRTELLKGDPAAAMSAVYAHLGLPAPASSNGWSVAYNTGSNPGIHSKSEVVPATLPPSMLDTSLQMLCNLLDYNRHLGHTAAAGISVPILPSDKAVCAPQQQ